MEKEFFEISDTGVLLSYHSEEVNVSIPDDVSEIGIHAFHYCRNMETILFPEHLKRINPYAFLHCTSLTHIILPDSIQIVEDHAFAFCENLECVRFTDSGLDVTWFVMNRTKQIHKDFYESLPKSQKIMGITSFRKCSPKLEIQGNKKKTSMSTKDNFVI